MYAAIFALQGHGVTAAQFFGQLFDVRHQLIVWHDLGDEPDPLGLGRG
jgi:hypothetical protein